MFCPKCGASVKDDHQFCTNCGARIESAGIDAESSPPPSPAANAVTSDASAGPQVYAGFWRRVAAMIIDVLCIYTFVFALTLSLGLLGRDPDAARGLAILITWLLGIFYWWGLESSTYQGTLGKLVIGIKVTDLHGQRIGFWHAAGRNISRIVSTVPFYAGYIAPAFSRRKQAFHDMVANTLVVKRQYGESEIAAISNPEHRSSNGLVAVVVAIAGFVMLGIIAAVAIPAYADYTTRAQVAEGLNMVRAVKAATAEFYARSGRWPQDNRAVGLVNARQITGKYVASVNVRANQITVAFRDSAPAGLGIQGRNLVFTAGSTANGDIVWQCGSKPMTLQGPVAVEIPFEPVGAGGTIAMKYRPAECRG